MRHIENLSRTNATLNSLSLRNTGAKGAALGQFFVALKENNAMQLEHLCLAGNCLDVRTFTESELTRVGKKLCRARRLFIHLLQ